MTHFLRRSRILSFNAHAPDKTRRADYITWQLELCSIGKEQTLYPKLKRAWNIAFFICHNARCAGLPCNKIVRPTQTNRPHARSRMPGSARKWHFLPTFASLKRTCLRNSWSRAEFLIHRILEHLLECLKSRRRNSPQNESPAWVGRGSYHKL